MTPACAAGRVRLPMVVGVIDEIRLTAEYRDGEWTVTGEAESELGVDLFELVEEIGKRLGFDPRELLEHLFKADVDPRLAVGSARVEHGPEATRIGAQLVLPPVLASAMLSEAIQQIDHAHAVRCFADRRDNVVDLDGSSDRQEA